MAVLPIRVEAHPEAKRAKKLHAFAPGAMAEALRLNLALGPDLMELANAMALNAGAMTNLRETLPKASKIKPTFVRSLSGILGSICSSSLRCQCVSGQRNEKAERLSYC